MTKRKMFALATTRVTQGIIAGCLSLLLILLLSLVACTGSKPTPEPASKPSGPIKAKWIESEVTSDTASIPLREVKNNWNVHFGLRTKEGDINFMAYMMDGETYVRANVCPPCRSIGFSLQKDTLICNACRTTFKAKTGDGIAGACVDYPKASAPYEIADGNIVMKSDDLITAYINTLKPGLP